MPESEEILQAGRRILANIVSVSKNVGIYPTNHPTVMEPAGEICHLLKRLCADRSQVSFYVVNSEIYVEKQLLREESIKYSDFIGLLTAVGLNSLSMDSRLTPESLAGFFAIVNKKEALHPEYLKNEMIKAGIRGISFERLVALDLAKDVYDVSGREESASVVERSSYGGALDCMESLGEDVMSNGPINTDGLQAVISSLMEDFLNDRDAVMKIMTIKNYDRYLFHHSINVAIISLLIASKLPLDQNQMRTVGMSGLLHDIGKLMIPREVVNKAGGLSEEEWVMMRRHPIEGAQILMRYESLGELPVLAALEHHAGYDLSGYPTLNGRKRPHALSRMVCIADVYEAITATRSYRPARNVNKAVETLLEGSGKQFDPMLVKLLLNVIGFFPPGSIVRLKNGEKAVVVEPNEDNPFFPKVRPLGEPQTNPADSPIIDTAEEPSAYAILGVADSEDI